MSALCGLLRLDGRAASLAEAQAALARMRHRGPDGVGVWAEGPLALGQAYLQTVPERETLPLAAGPFTLVADARLDNRAALLPGLRADLRTLGLDGPAPPDGALILAAVARWGARAPERLVGDFAYAAWDARSSTLRVARDRLGVRQLFVYHAPGRLLAFATESAALLAIPGVPDDVDGERVAETLSGRLFDAERAVFRGVDKFPAAHALVATPARVGLPERYWTLRVGSAPLGDAAEGFVEHFHAAVRAHVRSSHPVAAELSGGLDSSSVSVAAAEALHGQPLHTLSAFFPESKGSDETPFIDAVHRTLGGQAVPHPFFPGDERFVDLHVEIFGRVDEGRTNGNHHFNYLSLREAHRAGARVMLTGQDGDTTVGHGWHWFAEQTRAGGEGAAAPWGAMRAEADRVVARLAAERDAYAGQMTYASPGALVNAYAVPVLRAWARQKRLVPLVRATRGLGPTFGVSPRAVARAVWPDLLRPEAMRVAQQRTRTLTTSRAAVPPTVPPGTREGLAARIAASESARVAADEGVPSEAEAQRRMLTSGYLEGSFERLDLYGGVWQVEARHPFMHVPLVEYCLSLPSDEKLRDGYSRSVLRRALGGLLPPEVAWRANKSNLAAPQGRFLSSDPARVDELLADAGAAAAFVHVPALADLWARRASLTDWEEAWLTNGLAVAIWLRVRGGQPV